jgi:prepilin-type N-terminal cleavage/methylation domain-containing protein
MKARPGFSLIELIIVVTLVAVLVAVGLPRYTTFAHEGKVAACRENFAAINLAISAYQGDHPESTDKWAEIGGTISTGHPLVAQRYLDGLPQCRVNRAPYLLVRSYGPYGNIIGWHVLVINHFAGNWKTSIHIGLAPDEGLPPPIETQPVL